jgi:hypothetical protein
MARKTIDVTIQAEGRDRGKVLSITELPASQAEKWATRALLALSKAGVEIPDNIADAGLAGVAILGLKALGGMSFKDAEPLLDEMMACVKIKPSPHDKPEIIRSLVESDIEEIATRVFLRSAVFELHTGFSFSGGVSRLTQETPTVPASQNTLTSPVQSAPSSPPVRQRSAS